MAKFLKGIEREVSISRSMSSSELAEMVARSNVYDAAQRKSARIVLAERAAKVAK